MASELKAVKISKQTYEELCAIAGELQIKTKKSVSLDEAIKYLIRRSKKGKKFSDLADLWVMSDDEADVIKTSIAKGM